MPRKILILAVLLLSTFLRFYRLEAQSFWNDEGNSARIAERSVDLILAGAAGDIHPPGYYLILSAWRAALGPSEFALRGFSAFAGIVLVALVYRLGKQYFDTPAATAAAFFAAVHPALIYYSQEVRMYSLIATLGAAAFLALSLWLVATRQPAVGSRQPKFGVWDLKFGISPVIFHSSFVILITALGLYTHYSFAFIVIAVNLTALGGMAFHRTRATPHASRVTHWFTLQLFALLLLFAPWLPTAIHQITTWPSAREYLPLWDSFIGVSRWLTLGPTIDAASAVPALIGAAVLLLLSLRRRGQTITPLLWLIVPTGLTFAFGLFSQAFAKFLIAAVPALCLLMGNGAVGAGLAPAQGDRKGRPYVNAIALIASALILISTAATLNNLYFNPVYARADYRGIARTLDSIARPGDAVLLNAPNQWEVFTYYHPDTSTVFPLARSRPLDAPSQIAELEQIAASHDRLFVLYWGEAQSDPNRVIESWLNEHTFKAYDQWFSDVRLAVYAVPRAAAELQTRTGVNFGDQITLEGYALNAAEFAPGDILQLTLFWRADKPIDKRYKVFVHLGGDPASPPVAQHDGEPGGGLSLTTAWQPGQTIADNHGVYLPIDLAPGAYSLVVGLYSVDDGARLTHAGGDSLFLSAITVR